MLNKKYPENEIKELALGLLNDTDRYIEISTKLISELNFISKLEATTKTEQVKTLKMRCKLMANDLKSQKQSIEVSISRKINKLARIENFLK